MRRKTVTKTLAAVVGLLLMSAPVVLADHCQCDFDCDGNVYPSDLSVFLGEYGATDCTSCPLQSTPCEGTLSPLGRWCDQGNGTVKDMTTGLVWLQKADWGGAKLWEDCTTNDDAHTRAGLLHDGMAGANLSDGSVEGDWRLPTKTELVGIIVGDEYISSSQMYFFTGVQADNYWSSTSSANPIFAWVVRMDTGAVGGIYKVTYWYVWPVRSDS